MSSRFLKKVKDIYGNAEHLNQSKEDELIENNDELSYSCTNKFNLLLSDSSDNEEIIDKPCIEENKNTQIKIAQKTKSKPKKKKKVIEYEKMTEDEILDMFGSLAADVTVVDQKNSKSIDTLELKLRNLNENIELQQLFGPPTETGPGTQISRNRPRNTNPLLQFTFGKRSLNWPNVSVRKLGLQMERCNNHPSGTNWCLVTCSQDHLNVERALKSVMRTGDFQEHLRQHPYHVNTLLQVASMLAHQEDFTVAADLLKRVFYVYESIAPLGLSLLGSRSTGSLTKSSFSLEYRYRPNRGIFIALFQWILYLAQKSCFNTALEYCKVLFNLNIDSDPLAIILLMDDLAIRSDQYDFLIWFYDQFESRKSLKYLPNYSFSLAICHFFRSLNPGNKDSTGALSTADGLLQSALRLFPTFIASVAEHCRVQLPNDISQSSLFSTNDDPTALRALIELYGRRSMNFWKNASVLDWLECNARRVLEQSSASVNGDSPIDPVAQRRCVIDMYSRETPLAIKRHMLLAGHLDLATRQSSLATVSGIAFDPFPPANSEAGFDHYGEPDVDLVLDESWLVNLLRSLAPTFGIVRQ